MTLVDIFLRSSPLDTNARYELERQVPGLHGTGTSSGVLSAGLFESVANHSGDEAHRVTVRGRISCDRGCQGERGDTSLHAAQRSS